MGKLDSGCSLIPHLVSGGGGMNSRSEFNLTCLLSCQQSLSPYLSHTDIDADTDLQGWLKWFKLTSTHFRFAKLQWKLVATTLLINRTKSVSFYFIFLELIACLFAHHFDDTLPTTRQNQLSLSGNNRSAWSKRATIEEGREIRGERRRRIQEQEQDRQRLFFICPSCGL